MRVRRFHIVLGSSNVEAMLSVSSPLRRAGTSLDLQRDSRGPSSAARSLSADDVVLDALALRRLRPPFLSHRSARSQVSCYPGCSMPSVRPKAPRRCPVSGVACSCAANCSGAYAVPVRRRGCLRMARAGPRPAPSSGTGARRHGAGQEFTLFTKPAGPRSATAL